MAVQFANRLSQTCLL